MALVKLEDSPFWYFDFWFEGHRYRRSTKKKSKQAAAAVEADVLLKLMEGQKPARRGNRTPTLREFSTRFLAWAQDTRTLQPNTRKFYQYGWRLLSFTPMAHMHIDQITAEIVDCTRFMRPRVDRRTGKATDDFLPCSTTYTNQALRTLKVMLGLAVEWKVMRDRTKFFIPKAEGRDRLIDGAAEAGLERELTKPVKNRGTARLRYQAWLVMLIMQDTGMRPEEVFEMRIENIYWADRRIWIPSGKSARARRFVGMSERMHEMMSGWCNGSEEPGWFFPARRGSKTGHLTSIAGGFKAARDRAGLDARIVPYAARHTFGTFGMRATGNVFAVSAQMGHADLKSMEPYQHQELGQLTEAINLRNSERDSKKILRPVFGQTQPHITRKLA